MLVFKKCSILFIKKNAAFSLYKSKKKMQHFSYFTHILMKCLVNLESGNWLKNNHINKYIVFQQILSSFYLNINTFIKLVCKVKSEIKSVIDFRSDMFLINASFEIKIKFNLLFSMSSNH